MLLRRCELEKAAALLALGVAIAFPVYASPATSGASTLAFDAVSVRPSAQESALKGVGFLNPAGDEAPPQGGLFSWNVSLPWLINFAYDLRSSQMRR